MHAASTSEPQLSNGLWSNGYYYPPYTWHFSDNSWAPAAVQQEQKFRARSPSCSSASSLPRRTRRTHRRRRERRQRTSGRSSRQRTSGRSSRHRRTSGRSSWHRGRDHLSLECRQRHQAEKDRKHAAAQKVATHRRTVEEELITQKRDSKGELLAKVARLEKRLKRQTEARLRAQVKTEVLDVSVEPIVDAKAAGSDSDSDDSSDSSAR